MVPVIEKRLKPLLPPFRVIFGEVSLNNVSIMPHIRSSVWPDVNGQTLWPSFRSCRSIPGRHLSTPLNTPHKHCT